MDLQGLDTAYGQELKGFFAAVNRLQMGLTELVSRPGVAALRPELEQYLGQMADLGHRLERVFSLVNQKSLRMEVKNLNALGLDFQMLCASKLGNNDAQHSAG